MWRSDNSNEHDNRDKPVSASIANHLPDSIQIPQYINPKPFITLRERDADQVLLTMRGDGILESWSHKTIHSSSHHNNSDNEISEEEGLGLFSGEESCGHRYFETRQSSPSNCGCHEIFGHRSLETSHSYSSHF